MVPHINLPPPDRDLDGSGSAPLLAPAVLRIVPLVYDSQQNNQLHNMVANDPVLVQRIASATANLKDLGVDLQQAARNNSAPYIRSELAVNKAVAAIA